jgi:hypothetical protein
VRDQCAPHCLVRFCYPPTPTNHRRVASFSPPARPDSPRLAKSPEEARLMQPPTEAQAASSTPSSDPAPLVQIRSLRGCSSLRGCQIG